MDNEKQQRKKDSQTTLENDLLLRLYDELKEKDKEIQLITQSSRENRERSKRLEKEYKELMRILTEYKQRTPVDIKSIAIIVGAVTALVITILKLIAG